MNVYFVEYGLLKADSRVWQVAHAWKHVDNVFSLIGHQMTPECDYTEWITMDQPSPLEKVHI